MPARPAIVASPPDRESRVGVLLAAWAMGAGVTALLFVGLAHVERREQEAPPPDIADLRAGAIAELPPPPPEERREAETLPTLLPGFEAAAAESPVRVAVPPPDVAALLPPPAAAPPAVIQFGRLHSEFKPKLDTGEFKDRIYQRSEVDQAPRVLNRVYPNVPPVVRDNAPVLRTTLLFTVEPNGELGNIRVAGSSGNEAFDQIIVETIQEWSFSPAVRRGRKVRCLVEQMFTVKWTGGSRFER
jgi:TonB family protein